MSTFITERTRIIPYDRTHIADILKMFAEPDSNKFIFPLQNKTEEEYIVRLSENAQKNKEKLQYWSVYELETNTFIGTMNLNVFLATGQDQLGLHLAREFWGKGFGFEICKPLVEYAFEVRKLPVLYWVFEKEHVVSQKLATKLGFTPSSEMVEEGSGCELIIYELINPKLS